MMGINKDKNIAYINFENKYKMEIIVDEFNDNRTFSEFDNTSYINLHIKGILKKVNINESTK